MSKQSKYLSVVHRKIGTFHSGFVAELLDKSSYLKAIVLLLLLLKRVCDHLKVSSILASNLIIVEKSLPLLIVNSDSAPSPCEAEAERLGNSKLTWDNLVEVDAQETPEHHVEEHH